MTKGHEVTQQIKDAEDKIIDSYRGTRDAMFYYAVGRMAIEIVPPSPKLCGDYYVLTPTLIRKMEMLENQEAIDLERRFSRVPDSLVMLRKELRKVRSDIISQQ